VNRAIVLTSGLLSVVFSAQRRSRALGISYQVGRGRPNLTAYVALLVRFPKYLPLRSIGEASTPGYGCIGRPCLNIRDVAVLQVLPLDFRFTLVLGQPVGDTQDSVRIDLWRFRS
jgi:hypothetical protein